MAPPLAASKHPSCSVRWTTMPRSFFPAILIGTCLTSLAGCGSPADDAVLTLATTTSTENTGLLAYLHPHFEEQTGIRVKVVAKGTGAALQLARDGNADLVLVHAREQEDRFVADGFGVLRRDAMYNDFVLLGPESDPAGVRGAKTAADALKRIAAAGCEFVSRGDDSGTHKAELRLWKAAGIDPSQASGGWYRETGGGMGATLNVAAELPAYTLADRATWLAFRNRRELALLVEGDASLRNPYGVLVVNPALHPHVKVELATRFADWLTGPAGRAAVESFTLDGKPLFFLLPPTETRFSPTTRP